MAAAQTGQRVRRSPADGRCDPLCAGFRGAGRSELPPPGDRPGAAPVSGQGARARARLSPGAGRLPPFRARGPHFRLAGAGRHARLRANAARLPQSLLGLLVVRLRERRRQPVGRAGAGADIAGESHPRREPRQALPSRALRCLGGARPVPRGGCAPTRQCRRERHLLRRPASVRGPRRARRRLAGRGGDGPRGRADAGTPAQQRPGRRSGQHRHRRSAAGRGRERSGSRHPQPRDAVPAVRERRRPQARRRRSRGTADGASRQVRGTQNADRQRRRWRASGSRPTRALAAIAGT